MSMMKEKLANATNRWSLTKIETIYEHSCKAVYSADSAEFGPVILKLNQDTVQLKEEYDMLYIMNGTEDAEEETSRNKYCCRIFAYDEVEGMLLEERLLPGTVLREEESLETRLGAFEQVFRSIHKEVPEDGRQTYLDWLEEICMYCAGHKENRILTEQRFGELCLAELAEQAREICKALFQRYKERVLLHGDLHHDNILLREDGCYAMIDPKGVVGPEILDLPRYIMNEIDTKYTGSPKEHMQKVVRQISDKFGYPLLEVVQAYVMEVVLGNVWCVEDGEEINVEEISIAIEILKETELISNNADIFFHEN